MKVLITGHKGYIGALLTDQMTHCVPPHEVYGVDSGLFVGTELYSMNNVSRLKEFSGDFRDLEEADLRGIDCVMHLAALSNDPIGEIDPEASIAVNGYASISFAKRCKDAGVKVFLFGSSCSVYGASPDACDERSHTNPLTAYAKSKLIAEEGISELSDENFYTLSLRNGTAFGLSPAFRADLVINKMTADAYLTGKINVMGGAAYRPFVHANDIASVFRMVAENILGNDPSFAFAGLNGDCLNVSGGNFSIETIAKYVLATFVRTTTKEVEVITNESVTDKRDYLAQTERFQGLFPGFLFQRIEPSVEKMILAFGFYRYEGGDRYVRLAQIKKRLEANPDLFRTPVNG